MGVGEAFALHLVEAHTVVKRFLVCSWRAPPSGSTMNDRRGDDQPCDRPVFKEERDASPRHDADTHHLPFHPRLVQNPAPVPRSGLMANETPPKQRAVEATGATAAIVNDSHPCDALPRSRKRVPLSIKTDIESDDPNFYDEQINSASGSRKIPRTEYDPSPHPSHTPR
jgi:hypothetical protein